MTAQLAFYKGPPTGALNLAGYWGIRVWTWSRWSHVELVLNGICWSASAWDGGVRGKHIDLNSGHWDVIALPLTDEEAAYALAWFRKNEGARFDYRNILRFILPLIGHNRRQVVCFESVASALGLAAPHKLTANDLWAWAETRLDDQLYHGGVDDREPD